MKLILRTAALASAFALAACGGGEQHNNSANAVSNDAMILDNAAGTIENVADNATGNTADMLGNQVEAVENAADAAASSASNTASNAAQ